MRRELKDVIKIDMLKALLQESHEERIESSLPLW